MAASADPDTDSGAFIGKRELSQKTRKTVNKYTRDPSTPSLKSPPVGIARGVLGIGGRVGGLPPTNYPRSPTFGDPCVAESLEVFPELFSHPFSEPL